jgi:hypothetical protein
MPMPEVGQEFVWCGARFQREAGEIEKGLFPVTYVEAVSDRVKAGTKGLMSTDEIDNFRVIGHCDKCGQELPRVRGRS